MQNVNYKEVAEAIPWGREKFTLYGRITRQELAEKFGVSDRVIRKAIEEARANGYFIVNNQDGTGYYRTLDADEVERQYRQDTARAMAILKRRKHMRHYLRGLGRDVK